MVMALQRVGDRDLDQLLRIKHGAGDGPTDEFLAMCSGRESPRCLSPVS